MRRSGSSTCRECVAAVDRLDLEAAAELGLLVHLVHAGGPHADPSQRGGDHPGGRAWVLGARHVPDRQSDRMTGEHAHDQSERCRPAVDQVEHREREQRGPHHRDGPGPGTLSLDGDQRGDPREQAERSGGAGAAHADGQRQCLVQRAVEQVRGVDPEQLCPHRSEQAGDHRGREESPTAADGELDDQVQRQCGDDQAVERGEHAHDEGRQAGHRGGDVLLQPGGRLGADRAGDRDRCQEQERRDQTQHVGERPCAGRFGTFVDLDVVDRPTGPGVPGRACGVRRHGSSMAEVGAASV